MRVDLLGLEAFFCIADRGSFHRAAAHLNLSQTALSHRMRKLEEDLGVKLLARTTRQVSLTPAGVELLPTARRILTDLDGTFESLRAKGRERQQHLTIGCLPTLATNVLPGMLARFAATHPDVALHVLDHSAAEITEAVQTGEAEFGITMVSAARFDLEITPLLKESFLIACPSEHPLAKQENVCWSDLGDAPVVRVGRQTGNRALIDEALGTLRESVRWQYEVQHLTTAVSFVRAGLALAILPEFALAASQPEGIVTRPLRNPSLSRPLGILSRKGVPLSTAADALLALVAAGFKAEDERRRHRRRAMTSGVV
ncbi:LysR family transcriptional regulator [Mangrovibrevibacter kandeliae]|uniref:LysR family transcriptional regulator n=1 Tax=Mangrovibrevibacter kandeliae TaxID=2968473 RepID=UPI002119495B|nr:MULTISPECIES: LysR family transcriptional regulator [unclassified Aurantimonas]MCQ8782687.1 LysR substrate-binding domain-containing protein [Aurantimonas sp. CSK15Z-1]MCW4114504.1 LysR substrate-binding domain-containing protein [Aurantimonas sp. MSK8Z-1]